MTKVQTKMKQTGIPWIGEIPEDWDIKKLKYVSNLYTGNSIKDEKKDKYPKGIDTIPYVSTKNIEFGTNIIDYNVDIFTKITDTDFKIASKNSILICIEGGSAGKKIGFLDRDVSFVNKLCCINYYHKNKYLYYYLQSNSFRKEFDLNMSGLIGGVSQNYLKLFSIAIPPLQLQSNIINFLDQKTSQINTFIKNKKRLIELLEEQKQRIINEVVLSGLNKGIKTKGSDIGNIPENWEIIKIKYLCYVKGRIGFHGLNSSEFTDNKELPFLVTGTDFINQKVNWETCYHISKERYEEDLYIQLEENDLLITKDGTIGKTAIVKNKPEFATLNSGIMVVRPNNRLKSDFLNIILNSSIFKNFIDLLYQGSTIKHLYQQDFNNFQIALPPTNIQNDIIEYLNIETKSINLAIEKIENELKLIEEYRDSLIYQAVTGKLNIQ